GDGLEVTRTAGYIKPLVEAFTSSFGTASSPTQRGAQISRTGQKASPGIVPEAPIGIVVPAGVMNSNAPSPAYNATPPAPAEGTTSPRKLGTMSAVVNGTLCSVFAGSWPVAALTQGPDSSLVVDALLADSDGHLVGTLDLELRGSLALGAHDLSRT